MSAALWLRDWAVMYDGFPEDYLTIDIESTGLSVEKDLIIQFGWCEIEKRKLSKTGSCIINWHNSSLVDPNWVRKRMESTAVYMKDTLHKTFPWTYEALEKGEKPISALTQFYELITNALQSNKLIVAHNGVGHDIPIIEKHFQRFLKQQLTVWPDEIWDTGALEKGSQLNDTLYEGELSGNFAYRVLARSDNVKWNLHEHAIPKYDLINKYNLDLTQSHTAPFDAYVTHLLFEEHRALAEKGLMEFPAC